MVEQLRSVRHLIQMKYKLSGKTFMEKEEWLQSAKNDLHQERKQERIVIKNGTMVQVMSKLANWKAYIQGYWIEVLQSMGENLGKNLRYCVNSCSRVNNT